MVVDAHPARRDAVVRDLTGADMEVVATAGDGPAAVRRARAARPDVLLLGLDVPGLPVAEVCRGLAGQVHVLALSAGGAQADVLAAARAGAVGCLPRTAGAGELADAVRRAAAGEPVFAPHLAGLLVGEFRRLAVAADPAGAPGGGPRLTARETEVLRLVAQGLVYRQIADRLVVSHRTVRNHVQNVLGKLRLHDRDQLARWARDNGLAGDR
ncbi:response regulator transcription factor [Streptomyces sp. RFCAC02]|uniref:LuxR C-terminal-related transcriptional regulator n=1 Tax=Streptomyces sp. RFCAC02 TaxID=2499143 RepID=UPI0010214D07|nr:response regulator transcription factor [Streptomyces sp. RFCAC02]